MSTGVLPVSPDRLASGQLRSAQGSVWSRALGGLSWRILGGAGGVVGALVTSAAAARLVGPRDFGAVLLVLLTLALGPTVVRAGLGNNAIRVVARSVSGGDEPATIALLRSIVRAAALLAVALSLPVALLILATARPDLAADVPLLALALFFETVRLTASDLFTGLQMTRWAVLYSFQFRGLVVGATLLGMTLGRLRISFTEFLLILVIINAVLSVPAVLRLQSMWASRARTTSTLELRALIRGSAPFLASEIGLFVIARGDIWVAARLLGPVRGSVYGAASVLAVQLMLPLAVANLALAPLASSLAHQGRTLMLESLARLIATVASVATLVGVAAVILAGRQILDITYGSRFAGGQVILLILAIGSVAAVVTGPCQFVLLMSGRQRDVMKVVLGCAGSAGLLLVAGALLDGGVGLAIASSLATVGCNVLLMVETRRSLEVWTLPYFSVGGLRQAWGVLQGDLHPEAAE